MRLLILIITLTNNMYQLDNNNGSALICILMSLFYYKSTCRYLWNNYDSNILIYLQEYLNYIFNDLENNTITLKDSNYIVEILRPLKFSLKPIFQKYYLTNQGNIIKDLYTHVIRLFEITCQEIEIKIKNVLLDNSLYYSFLISEEKNILDLFNEWNEKNQLNELEYLVFYIKKDKNTRINIQKKLLIKTKKYYFRSVICYSLIKSIYYVIIKILSSYYLFEFNDIEQFKKVKINKMADLIKTECIMILYKKCKM